MLGANGAIAICANGAIDDGVICATGTIGANGDSANGSKSNGTIAICDNGATMVQLAPYRSHWGQRQCAPLSLSPMAVIGANDDAIGAYWRQLPQLAPMKSCPLVSWRRQ